MRSRGTLALVAVAVALAAPRLVRAQDDGSVREDAAPTDRLSLTVHGKAEGVADSVEIELVVEASAEDAPEAERRERTKLQAVLKALEELRRSIDARLQPQASPAAPSNGKPAATASPAPDAASPRVKKRHHAADDEDDDASPADDAPAKKRARAGDDDETSEDASDGLAVPIEVREGRSIFGLARGENQQDKTPQATVATAVQIHMKGLATAPRAALRKRLARIVDAAVGAGADSGGADSGGPVGHGVRPAFRFKVKDNEALRAEAYKVAVETGRARAANLARLAGRELAELTCVRETAWQLRAGTDDSGVGFDVIVGRVGNNRPNNHDLLVSTTECELEVELQLDFLLKPVSGAVRVVPAGK